jgi:hypothetical protein
VDGVEGVVQGADHHVDHLRVAHAGTPARVQAGVGGTAHALCATTDGNVAVTQRDGLGCGDDRLQPGAAQPVDVEGRSALAAAAVDGRHAGQVHVLGFGIHHMAEHHMADVRAGDVHAVEGFAHDLGAEIGRTDVLEGASEGADGGSHGADNNNFTVHGGFLGWAMEKNGYCAPGRGRGRDAAAWRVVLTRLKAPF